MEPGSGIQALASGCYGLGAAVLIYSLVVARRRAATARRMSTFVVAEAQVEQAVGIQWTAMLQEALRRGGVFVRAHTVITRTVLIVITLSAILVAFSSLSFMWFGVAGLSAGAIFFVSGKSRGQQQVEEQAPAALTMLASGLRAGYSVQQGIALVAREFSEPTASQFAIVERELALGVDLATAMLRLAERTGNPDYELVAIIISIQHEIGGNLSEILDSVAGTLRERFELRQMVGTLTAQQRMSSMILTLLPVAVLGFLTLANRSFVMPLYTETTGQMLLALVGVLLVLGWSVMRSITRIAV